MYGDRKGELSYVGFRGYSNECRFEFMCFGELLEGFKKGSDII